MIQGAHPSTRCSSPEAKFRFKMTQGGQDAHVLGMSILKICPVINSSVQKATETLIHDEKQKMILIIMAV